MNKERLYLSTIDENADILAQKYGLGIEFSEFSTAWNLDEHFEETDRRIRENMKAAHRFTLHGPFNELFPCAVDPKARDLAANRFRQTIKISQSYGIHKVIFHAGFNPFLYYPCWFEEQSILFWKEFMKDIPDGMVICLENVLEETPEMMTDILRSIDSPKIRMCLDVGHANAYAKVKPEDWIAPCSDWIDHFHIHNNDGHWDEHQPLFQGTIPMKSLLNQIDLLCPNATLTMELPHGESSIMWLKTEQILEV